jgi:hypothetical protein
MHLAAEKLFMEDSFYEKLTGNFFSVFVLYFLVRLSGNWYFDDALAG